MPGPDQRAPTVVVVDDEPHVVDYLSTVVHLEGFVLLGTANDADTAVREVAHLKPDVVLLDLHMPGGGPDAVRLIGALAPETRIVIFSSDADEPSILPLIEAGIHGYVLKGVPPERIGEAIRAAVEGETYLAPAVGHVAVGALNRRLDAEQRDDLRRRRERDEVRDVIAQHRFRPVVQPIVELASRRTVGVEALTRFTTSGPRTPEQWFAQAGRAGLRTQLELATAHAALGELDQLPAPLTMAINVSPTTVLSGRLGEVFLDRPLGRVVLELTEQTAVEDYARLGAALAPWRALGARLALDDVGSGYAGFTHVLRLRPEVLKLDRDLVRDIHVDRQRQALARAVVSYAQEVGVDVVAEGLETEAECAMAAELGARLGQGYHLGRPAPLVEVVDRAAR